MDRRVYVSPVILPTHHPLTHPHSDTAQVEEGAEEEQEQEERKEKEEKKEEEQGDVVSINPQLFPSHDHFGVFGLDGCWYPIGQYALPQGDCFDPSAPPLPPCPVDPTQDYTPPHPDSTDAPLHPEPLPVPKDAVLVPPSALLRPRCPEMLPASLPCPPRKTDMVRFMHSPEPQGMPQALPVGMPQFALPYPEWTLGLAPPCLGLPGWMPGPAPPFPRARRDIVGVPRHPMMAAGLVRSQGRGPRLGGPLIQGPQMQLLPFYNYYHQLDLPVNTFGRPRLLHSIPRKGHPSVEDVWCGHMNALFRNFPDPWSLRPAKSGWEPSGSKWNTFKDLAKVRFYCEMCSDGWTSMYGIVVFRYRQDQRTGAGTVVYQLAGQKCRECQPPQEQDFQLPLWYPEEAQKVITNLYYNIAATCYGLVTPQYIRTRRMGMPLAHHNKLLCQGCAEGVCKLYKVEKEE